MKKNTKKRKPIAAMDKVETSNWNNRVISVLRGVKSYACEFHDIKKAMIKVAILASFPLVISMICCGDNPEENYKLRRVIAQCTVIAIIELMLQDNHGKISWLSGVKNDIGANKKQFNATKSQSSSLESPDSIVPIGIFGLLSAIFYIGANFMNEPNKTILQDCSTDACFVAFSSIIIQNAKAALRNFKEQVYSIKDNEKDESQPLLKGELHSSVVKNLQIDGFNGTCEKISISII